LIFDYGVLAIVKNQRTLSFLLLLTSRKPKWDEVELIRSHIQRFNGHLPGEPGLAGCTIYFPSPFILDCASCDWLTYLASFLTYSWMGVDVARSVSSPCLVTVPVH